MNEISVTPIPDKEKDEVIAAWSAKIPAVGDKLAAAKSDQEFRQAILESHKIDETALNNRVGG